MTVVKAWAQALILLGEEVVLMNWEQTGAQTVVEKVVMA
jgi:hypothetical protein